MSSTKDNTTTISIQTPVDIALPQSLLDLRTAALKKTSGYGIPTLALIDAEAWRLHMPSEDWLEWRGRWSATRLREMPLDISSGELIVGRPLLRDPNEDEQEKIAAVKHVLDSIPPYPGGDPAHFHPDYEKLFRVGIRGVLDEIRCRKEQADTDDLRTMYNSCEIAMQGFSDYVIRVADECDANAGCAGEDADHWRNMAGICRKVAIAPPDTFHEAIELMFLTMIALWFGDDHFLTTPGRMDQTLRRFYESDLSSGRITRERAFELICSLYIQCNMILFPGSALSVMVGGRDSQGRDVTNDLTYMCMDARLATHLVYPTVGIAWHENTPIELTKHACRMIATGVGDPAFFNDELIIAGLRKHGVSESDSYNYMNSTCVEIKVVGASNMWVTQPYFNCPEAILQVMDMVADETMPEPATFNEFCTAVKERLASTVRDAAVSLDKVWHDREERGCHPLASCLVSDCLEKGLDYDRGGARYNWVENSFVGLANLADSLMAIKKLVYEQGELSLNEFRTALKADYKGYEELRVRIANTIPSYGCDNDEVDAIVAEWADFLGETTESNVVGLHRYVPGFFCWIMHGLMGAQMGATPDGRRAGLALADGAGAAQGRETCGPTAAILSTTKWNHIKAIGGVVHNLKLSKNSLSGDNNQKALRSLIETYLRRGGFEIQINAVSADTLRDAQLHPENYADLVVRVAGYSDYFTHLDPVLQAEVISRTEHDGFGS